MAQKHIGDNKTLEMLRAFIALSKSPNLTRVSSELGLTRQTVRRYISHLEELKGAPLFALNRNNYALTPLGAAMVDDAKAILSLTKRWCARASTTTPTRPQLETSHCIDGDGRESFSQQHPLCHMSHKASPLVQEALAAWAASSAKLESLAFQKIRPHIIIYKKDPRGWLCVEIGDQSAYTRWFGWAWSKSAVGNLSSEDQAGTEFDRMVSETYSKVHRGGEARLDHVFAHLPREDSPEPVPVTFQRLLMTLLLPDQTPVLAVLVIITREVEIDALAQEMNPSPAENYDVFT